MKMFLAMVIGLAAGSAMAAEESSISTHPPQSAMVSTTNNLTEIGMEYSSINNGTPYATVGLIHEFSNGFSLGVRGDLPLQFASQSNSYIGQILGRFMLMNEINQMYLEPVLGEAFFNGVGPATNFAMFGLGYGYNRVLMKDLVVGAHVGVDYASARVVGDNVYSGERTFYSRIGLSGSYYF